MSTTNASAQAVALADKIRTMRFAMFTTVDEHGHLISHPMTNQDTDEQGGLWFYTSIHTPLWQNIALALGIKAVFLVLALAGSATMWTAVFADMCASLIVVANGLRLLRAQTEA